MAQPVQDEQLGTATPGIADPRRESLRILTFGWLGMGLAALLDMLLSQAADRIEIAIIAITSVTGVMVFALSSLKKHTLAAYLFCLSVDLTFFYLYFVSHQIPAANPVSFAETRGVTLAASGLGIVFAGALLNRWAPLAMAALNIFLLFFVIRVFLPNVSVGMSVSVIWAMLGMSVWLFATFLERMLGRLRHAHLDLRKQMRRLSENATLLNLASDAIFIEDSGGRILYWNLGAESIYGLPAAQMLGKRFSDVIVSHYPRPIKEIEEHLARYGRWEGELQQRLPDSREIWTATRFALRRDSAGAKASTLVINTDITHKKAQEAQVAFLTDHNLLTGLPNHALLVDRLGQAMLRARRDKQQLALILVDIDRLKSVNSGLGLPVGDSVLRIVADRLSAAVGMDQTVSHLAGDTFGLVVENYATTGDIAAAAEQIRAGIALPMEVLGHTVTVTASLGIASFPADFHDAEQLIRGANSAMLTAKERGRDRFCLYEPSHNQRHGRRSMMESALRRAIATNELFLAYQPKVIAHSGRICGVEALLRWRSAEFGDVLPADFIPLAEESDLIILIGNWVLETACRQAREWHDQGHSQLVLAVNISARQLQQAHIGESIEAILAATGLPASCLELEITESAIMQHVEHTLLLLEKLRRMGIQLSIDDFGTGYSGLNYLKRLPVQTLKIDQSFVRDLVSNSGDEAIVAAIISLAKNFNMRVIAEGVETSEQLAFLRSLHCDECQGYLFSRPVPAADFTALLDAKPVLPHAEISA